MTTDLAERPATFGEVFAVPAFRTLFASRTLAIAADTLRIVALSMLVFALTGSALWSAVTFGIGFLPQVVGGMLLGSLADRMRPRRLIVAGYAMECGAALALATLDLPVAASLAIVAMVGGLTPIFGGASSRLIAEVLTGDAYVLGRSISSMASGGAQLAGLAFGGVAVAALGPQRALLVAAVCHLIAALIVRFGLADLAAPPRTMTASAVRQSWRTNVDLLARPRVRKLLLIQWLPPAFLTGAEALIVAYCAIRGFPAGAVGLLLASVPAGMVVGDLVVGRLVAPATRTRLVAPLIALMGLPIALALDPPLATAGALLGLAGAGFGYSLGLQRSFLEALPEASRGQAFALLSTGLMTLQGVGPLVFGAVAEFAGVRAALVAAGSAALISSIAWWLRGR